MNATIKEREEAINQRNNGTNAVPLPKYGPQAKDELPRKALALGKEKNPQPTNEKRHIVAEVVKKGNKYVVVFKYPTKADAINMKNFVGEKFIPKYGSESIRAKMGLDYIVPVFKNEMGEAETKENGILAEIVVPSDLIADVTKGLVEDGHVVVKMGKETLIDKFDEDKFDKGLKQIDSQEKDKNAQTKFDDQYNNTK